VAARPRAFGYGCPWAATDPAPLGTSTGAHTWAGLGTGPSLIPGHAWASPAWPKPGADRIRAAVQ
jgi:hypothetical protein